MALIAVYLGEIDERKINRISYLFFEDIMSTLGRKINYDAVVNYAGNSFFEKSWDIITESNPMNKKQVDPKDKSGLSGLAQAFNSGKLKIK